MMMLYVGLSHVSKSHMDSQSAKKKLIWETVQMMPVYLGSLRLQVWRLRSKLPVRCTHTDYDIHKFGVLFGRIWRAATWMYECTYFVVGFIKIVSSETRFLVWTENHIFLQSCVKSSSSQFAQVGAAFPGTSLTKRLPGSGRQSNYNLEKL